MIQCRRSLRRGSVRSTLRSTRVTPTRRSRGRRRMWTGRTGIAGGPGARARGGAGVLGGPVGGARPSGRAGSGDGGPRRRRCSRRPSGGPGPGRDGAARPDGMPRVSAARPAGDPDGHRRGGRVTPRWRVPRSQRSDVCHVLRVGYSPLGDPDAGTFSRTTWRRELAKGQEPEPGGGKWRSGHAVLRAQSRHRVMQYGQVPRMLTSWAVVRRDSRGRPLPAPTTSNQDRS